MKPATKQYNPVGRRVVVKDGLTYYYNRDGYLVMICDAKGDAIEIHVYGY